MRQVDLTGRVFARLAVQRLGARLHGKIAWQCLCECGKEALVSSTNLVTGNTRSCGCLALDAARDRGIRLRGVPAPAKRTHGMSRTRTYRIWIGAKMRCFNPAVKCSHNYLGRGITMCVRWRESFENFLSDMGEAPARMTLERKDVNRDYEPGNCVWATVAEQGQNTRRTKLNWAAVRDIRARHAAGTRTGLLAKEYGVSVDMVRKTVAGLHWKEIA